MASPKTSTINRGFTLVEVLVVIGLFTVIASVALFVSMDDYRGYSFRSERDLLISVIEKARSQALSGTCLGTACAEALPHGVHFEAGKYVIFQGASYHDTPANAAVDETVEQQNKAVSISGFTDVIFSPLSATATIIGGSNPLVLSSPGASSELTINPEGRICSDDPSC